MVTGVAVAPVQDAKGPFKGGLYASAVVPVLGHTEIGEAFSPPATDVGVAATLAPRRRLGKGVLSLANDRLAPVADPAEVVLGGVGTRHAGLARGRPGRLGIGPRPPAGHDAVTLATPRLPPGHVVGGRVAGPARPVARRAPQDGGGPFDVKGLPYDAGAPRAIPREMGFH